MKLVLISPEHDRADEHAVLVQLFAVGLERYHVRKPHVSARQLEEWLEAVPAVWRSRLVLHQHHALVAKLGLGGRHWRDADAAQRPLGASAADEFLSSRSCHDLLTLRASLGVYDAVFFGPMFASISKPGYGPKDAQVGEALAAVLRTRTARESETEVIALGGITVATAPQARAFGFDGVAVLGTVWQATDPVAAFRELADVCAGTPPNAPGHPGPLLTRAEAKRAASR